LIGLLSIKYFILASKSENMNFHNEKASNHQNASDPQVSPSYQQEGNWHHPGGKLIELGSHSLKQAELLAILIGAGVQGRSALSIANAILDIYIGLYGIHREATIESLAQIPGLGKNKAARVLAAI
jgi:DNA repair protein RadC